MRQYLYIGLAIILLGMSGTIAFQVKKIDRLNQDIATERANVQIAKDAVQEANDSVLLLEVQRERDQHELNLLAEEMNDVENERDEERERLNTFRSRLQEDALAKPELIGRMATRATERVFLDFFTASGGKTSPSDREISSTPTESSPSDQP